MSRPSRHMKPVGALLALVAGVAGLAACRSESPVAFLPRDRLASGTWGGQNAGLIVEEAVAHVHVGCTYGDFPAPVALDAEGRFNVAGEYLLRAFPVAVGPTMPARFAGVLRERTLTLTVAVNDTVEKTLVLLGPVTVVFGSEPQLAMCPICRTPGAR